MKHTGEKKRRQNKSSKRRKKGMTIKNKHEIGGNAIKNWKNEKG
jgi:hypothetical protein